jgi:hypothetical protein
MVRGWFMGRRIGDGVVERLLKLVTPPLHPKPSIRPELVRVKFALKERA